MRRFSAFTLIELLIVLFIVGVIASVSLPRIYIYTEPPVMTLQRCIEEASNLALSGVSVKMTTLNGARGKIHVQALMKSEAAKDDLSTFMHSNENDKDSEKSILEWREVKLKNLPQDDNWKFEPSVIYFFNDGSCTPAKISWLSPNTRRANINNKQEENYILTVTGYCVEVDENLTKGY